MWLPQCRSRPSTNRSHLPPCVCNLTATGRSHLQGHIIQYYVMRRPRDLLLRNIAIITSPIAAAYVEIKSQTISTSRFKKSPRLLVLDLNSIHADIKRRPESCAFHHLWLSPEYWGKLLYLSPRIWCKHLHVTSGTDLIRLCTPNILYLYLLVHA